MTGAASEHVDRREGSKVDRLIRKVFEETRVKLLAELAPVEGDFRKVLEKLQQVRNLIEVLIGLKLGDHPICAVNDPREFFAEALKARPSEIRELVDGKHLTALLAYYDEIAAVVKPLRAAVADVDRLLGVRGHQGVSETAVDGVEDIKKSVIAWISTRGSIRVTDGCARNIGCSRADLDGAITSLLIAREIQETGGSETQGIRYGFSRNGAGEVGGGNGRIDRRIARYGGVRSGIREAIFAELRDSDIFVNSGDFCRKNDCDSPVSLQVVKALVEDGILTQEGNGRATKYRITEKGRGVVRAAEAVA